MPMTTSVPHQIDALIGEVEVDRDVGMEILEREDQPADIQQAEHGGTIEQCLEAVPAAGLEPYP